LPPFGQFSILFKDLGVFLHQQLAADLFAILVGGCDGGGRVKNGEENGAQNHIPHLLRRGRIAGAGMAVPRLLAGIFQRSRGVFSSAACGGCVREFGLGVRRRRALQKWG